MEIFNLSNGIRVVFEKIDYVMSVSVGVFVRAGSVFETKNQNGISHFLEHMFFKGTEKRSAKEIAEFMDSCGGQLNALTSKEYTCFYAKVLSSHGEKAFDILSDMLVNSSFSEENTELEKKVVTEEIKIGNDTPEELIFDMISELTWENSSIGFPIAGTEENVNSFKRDDILKYYGKHYNGDGIVISVVGNYDGEKLRTELEKYFSKISSGGGTEKIAAPESVKSGILIKQKDIEQCQLCIAFEGMKRDDPLVYDLLAANAVFGGSMSSRLFQKIREENGLSYSVYSYINSYTKCGSLVIYAGMNPAELEKVLELMNGEIKKLKEEKLGKTELLYAAEQIKSGLIMGLESVSQRMSSYGKNLLLDGKINTMENVIEKISKISCDGAAEAIEKVFDISKMNIALLGSIDKKNYGKNFSF